MAAFAEVLREVDIGRCGRADCRRRPGRPVLPGHPLPVHRSTRTAPTWPRCCGRPTSRPGSPTCRSPLTRESDGIGQDARLYLVPSTKQLLSPTWQQLEELAAGRGGRLRLLLAGGARRCTRGPWYARLNAMFGVEHQLGYGAPARSRGRGGRRSRSCRTSARCRRAPGCASPRRAPSTSRSYLPVRPDGAEVLAVDGHDRPALLLRRVGRGLADPVHLSHRVHGRRHPRRSTPTPPARCTTRSRSTPASRRPVTVDDPRVAADVLIRADGSRFAWLVSHAG